MVISTSGMSSVKVGADSKFFFKIYDPFSKVKPEFPLLISSNKGQ